MFADGLLCVIHVINIYMDQWKTCEDDVSVEYQAVLHGPAVMYTEINQWKCASFGGNDPSFSV